ncbi:RDD family protein [Patescibacteria group bacterium]|nr:RDD family protein [Patescibacteria group bacterium]
MQNTLGDAAANIALVISIVLSIGYYVVYQEKQGQTIGKKAMKIKVVTFDGKTPTMFTFFLREIIGKTISAVILCVGYLMVIWDKKKQGLHDKIANTYVVYVEPAAAQQAVPTQQQAVPVQPTTIQQQEPTIPTAQTPEQPQQPV